MNVRNLLLKWAAPSGIFGLAVFGIYHIKSDIGEVSRSIGNLVHEAGAREIDLAFVTQFGWDRFYYFKSGTNREEICKFLGSPAHRCGMIVPQELVPEGAYTLVFTQDNRLRHIELHRMQNGEFDFPAGAQGLAREASVFRVRHNLSGSERERVVLEPK